MLTRRLAGAAPNGIHWDCGFEPIEQPLLLCESKLAQMSRGEDRAPVKVRSGAFGQTRELPLSVAGPVFEGVRVGRVAGADYGPGKPVAPVRRHELRLVAALIAETDFEQVRSAVALDGFVEQPSFDFGVERIARREARLQPPCIDLGMGEAVDRRRRKQVTGGGASGRVMGQPPSAVLPAA